MKSTKKNHIQLTNDLLKIALTSLFMTSLLSACGDGGGSSEEKTSVSKEVIVEVPKCLGSKIDDKTSCLEISNRKAILYKDNKETKDGIALFLHGSPGSANKVMGIFDAKMIATQHNLVAVSPEGIVSGWGWLSVNNSASNENSDVEYLTELITKVRSEGNINTDKLYIFGYSAGGFMAYRLACAMPEKITSIVSLAGQFRGNLDACETSTPLAIHHFHSTSDDAVPYNGRSLDSIKSVDDTIELWRINNGCDIDENSQEHVGVTANSSKTITLTYNNCLASVTLSKMSFVPHEAEYISQNLYQIYKYIFDTK
ncbi:hypothetical protein CXF85_20075 [Colwellia sp. 75C3]|uniref:alpha/beta hydrolase family esterase n=1 Tax=Colwellia sp. 75C3 TaxID=888425 RepID=UPI000C345C72|nr:hypothetical protein [Colwellia sp. 75C3]PKG81061.1 hypothetical protein CXF85_20075 [Colwellia sp. 75C3]